MPVYRASRYSTILPPVAGMWGTSFFPTIQNAESQPDTIPTGFRCFIFFKSRLIQEQIGKRTFRIDDKRFSAFFTYGAFPNVTQHLPHVALDHTAMCPVWGGDVWHIQAPKSLPDVGNVSKRFRLEYQLPGSTVPRGGPHWNKTANLSTCHYAQQQYANQFPHCCLHATRHDRIVQSVHVQCVLTIGGKFVCVSSGIALGRGIRASVQNTNHEIPTPLVKT